VVDLNDKIMTVYMMHNIVLAELEEAEKYQYLSKGLYYK
jgi:hypothetical protein